MNLSHDSTVKNEYCFMYTLLFQQVIAIFFSIKTMIILLLQGVKCEQYWPQEGKSAKYGDIKLTTNVEHNYSEYVLRKFTISKVFHICRVRGLSSISIIGSILFKILHYRRKVPYLTTKHYISIPQCVMPYLFGVCPALPYTKQTLPCPTLIHLFRPFYYF